MAGTVVCREVFVLANQMGGELRVVNSVSEHVPLSAGC